MAMKERRITCAACGERETVLRGERGPVSAYCDLCRAERHRVQTCLRMAALRDRHRTAGSAPSVGPLTTETAGAPPRTQGGR